MCGGRGKGSRTGWGNSGIESYGCGPRIDSARAEGAGATGGRVGKPFQNSEEECHRE